MNDLNSTICVLELNNNSIRHLDEESFSASERILHLDLSHNLIERVTVQRTFTKMRYQLSLPYNRIARLDPMIFYHIYHLDLTNNMLLETKFIVQVDNNLFTLSNNPIFKLEANMNVNTVVLSNSALVSYAVGPNVRELEIVNGILKAIDLTEMEAL